MAYMFGAAIKGIWGFVFPREHPHPLSTPENSTTRDDSADTDTPQAYSNHRMQSAIHTSATQPPSTAAQQESPADKIPWVQIHYAHVSNLRGQLRYLKLIGDKHDCADKVEEYIKRTRQALQDAKAAAIIAGIIPSPKSSNPALSKLKIHPTSKVAVPRYSKRTMTRDPPTAEKLAALTSLLGKHARDIAEEEESMSEKGAKRNRYIYIEKKYWKPYQYEGDVTDSEDDDEDDAEFAPMPDDIKSASPSSSTNSSPVSSDDSTAANEEPVAPTTTKGAKATTEDKEKTNSIPENGGNTAPTTEGQNLPKSTKHTAEDETSNPQTSAKKQKKNDTQRLIEDSSKRRAEHAEEPAEVVSGGNMKKQKLV